MPHFDTGIMPSPSNPGYQFLDQPLAVDVASLYHKKMPTLHAVFCPCCSRAVMQFSFLVDDGEYRHSIWALGCAGGCFVTRPFSNVATSWNEWMLWSEGFVEGTHKCMAGLSDGAAGQAEQDKLVARLERALAGLTPSGGSK